MILDPIFNLFSIYSFGNIIVIWLQLVPTPAFPYWYVVV